LKERLGQEPQLTKIHSLLVRQGVSVPYRTLHRFCVQELGFGRQLDTVRVVDGEPGSELQADFCQMGLLFDLGSQRRQLCWGRIFTACYSRYMFCWLSFEQTLAAVIEGFEQAWAYFGGVFQVVISDGMRAIMIKSDPAAPRSNAAFLEYAQARFRAGPGPGAAADRQATASPQWRSAAPGGPVRPLCRGCCRSP
jgi:transposase